ncbi:MAG: RNA-binding transcriptional accessory protein [Cytophagales bacterium]|nr:RNA-binding transcriptional accessory protein [Cytophagales bacterium]MDW8385343.1 Tex family protein [Flammeovirgaceae bacterium]
MEQNIVKLAQEFCLFVKHAQAIVKLLDEGATIPFIARYRKELTGSADEVLITQVRDRIAQLRELEKRKETVLKSIQEQGKLTEELRAKIEGAETISELEDIYLPYKPKRRTRATIAREKGLEPLATKIFSQEDFDLLEACLAYISEEKGVKTIEDALEGARDIVAELISENAEARRRIRHLFEKEGFFIAKLIEGKEEEGQKYRDYFDWSEPIRSAPSHRVLAMRRAEKEGIISLECAPDQERAFEVLENLFLKRRDAIGEQMKKAIRDAYRRFLKPSIETEIRILTKQKADADAIRVFADNLRQLLLAPPLGERNVLAIDPGYRTGCKVVCLNAQGKLLHHDVIYPNEPQRKVVESAKIIKSLCETYQIEAIAIGNGTASRETEAFVRHIDLPKHIQIVVVNESGASVYSASEVAREEFPNEDVTVRGAVSIGRRLMDPLAELVKIDPRAIGVGQYQHDVDPIALKQSLDDVVVSCVNAVGVEVNTASKQLLTYVSGIGETLAQNIVKYRDKHGPFRSREELKKVPRLGEKAFEQAAGFLRIRNAENPLDMSAVHPESYHIVEKMAKDLQCTVKDLMTKEELRELIKLENYITETVGLPTLQDILKELAKPGRDPRKQFEVFRFAEGIEKISDLKVGMKLPGIVMNITDFGAFVDIGVHQAGLLHISQISDKKINHPSEVLKVQQKVEVTVIDVDLKRNRISLSLKGEKTQEAKQLQARNKDKKKENLSIDEKLRLLQEKFRR